MAKGKKGGGGGNGGGGGGGGSKGKIKDKLLTGTAGDDFLFADNGNDTLDGLDGNDSLIGLNGDDLLLGGAGHDSMIGGLGADTLDGGDGNDFLQGSLGEDIIDGGSMNGEVNTASFEDLGGDGPPDASGFNDFGIVLTAGTAAGSYTATNDAVDASGAYITETDTLTNIHKVVGSNFHDSMTGGLWSDFFFGALGEDTIDGGGGDDTIFGGLEDDVLTGGTGADTFVFVRQADGLTAPPDEPAENYADAGTGDGFDIITDFEVGTDRLLFLSNEVFDFSLFTATYDATLGQTVLTYQAEADFFGPSAIILQGVNADLATLVDPLKDLQVDPDFDFMI